MTNYKPTGHPIQYTDVSSDLLAAHWKDVVMPRRRAEYYDPVYRFIFGTIAFGIYDLITWPWRIAALASQQRQEIAELKMMVDTRDEHIQDVVAWLRKLTPVPPTRYADFDVKMGVAPPEWFVLSLEKFRWRFSLGYGGMERMVRGDIEYVANRCAHEMLKPIGQEIYKRFKECFPAAEAIRHPEPRIPPRYQRGTAYRGTFTED